MNTINITQARKDLFGLVREQIVGFNPITIVNNRGGSAVFNIRTRLERYSGDSVSNFFTNFVKMLRR